MEKERVMLGTQMAEQRMIRAVLHCHWVGTHCFNYQVQQRHLDILMFTQKDTDRMKHKPIQTLQTDRPPSKFIPQKHIFMFDVCTSRLHAGRQVW